MAFVWSFLVYALILYVVSYVLVEYGQKYLYDEPPPYMAARVGAGALIMAGILTWTKSSFDTMFTAEVWKTVLLALIWAGVFILVFRFQPLHGAAFALAAVLLIPGLSSMVVQGVTGTNPDASRPVLAPKKAYRSGGSGTAIPPAQATTK